MNQSFHPKWTTFIQSYKRNKIYQHQLLAYYIVPVYQSHLRCWVSFLFPWIMMTSEKFFLVLNRFILFIFTLFLLWSLYYIYSIGVNTTSIETWDSSGSYTIGTLLFSKWIGLGSIELNWMAHYMKLY